MMPFLQSFEKKFRAFEDRQETFWKRVFLIGLPLISAILLGLSQGYGITWDEWLENHYGYLVLRNVLSWGENHDYRMWAHAVQLKSALYHAVVNLVYGSLFTNLGEFMKNGLHQDTHILGLMQLSHALNALSGWAGIAVTGLFARRLSGSWRTAAFAMLFLFLSPRFFGNSMNNPKDVPFAAAYLGTIYLMCRFVLEWPRPRWTTGAGIAAGLAAAIGIRSSGGLILIPYFMMFAGGCWLWARLSRTPGIPFKTLALHSFLILTAGYFGGLVFWPYGRENPLVNPLSALTEISRFETFIGTALFEGRLIPTNALPWYYIPKWILITSPLFFSAGFCILIPSALYLFRRYDRRILLFLIFSACFPVFFVILKKSILYDGWRHLMFAYPPLVILTAMAWDQLLRVLEKPLSRAAVLGVLAVFCLEPALWMVRNHPNQYVYFSPLIGGLKGAYGFYDTDYWGNCLRQSSDWLGRQPMNWHTQGPIVVRANGQLMSTYPFLRRGLGDAYIPLGHPPGFIEHIPQINITQGVLKEEEIRGNPGWHYAIAFSRDVPPEQLRAGAWPPSETVYTVEADGVPLCAVIENPALTRLKNSSPR